jgi:hypothetical protein
MSSPNIPNAVVRTDGGQRYYIACPGHRGRKSAERPDESTAVPA